MLVKFGIDVQESLESGTSKNEEGGNFEVGMTFHTLNLIAGHVQLCVQI